MRVLFCDVRLQAWYVLECCECCFSCTPTFEVVSCMIAPYELFSIHQCYRRKSGFHSPWDLCALILLIHLRCYKTMLASYKPHNFTERLALNFVQLPDFFFDFLPVFCHRSNFYLKQSRNTVQMQNIWCV